MEALAAKEKVVGLKQVRRAVASGKVRKVYLACDADPRLTEPVEALCQAAGIAVVTDYTMAQLGRACSIAVGTAAAAALEEERFQQFCSLRNKIPLFRGKYRELFPQF